MKRCPECRRDYYDDSLSYCLDDGTALLDGPAGGNEAKTAVFSDKPRGKIGAAARKQNRSLIALGAVLILMGLGGTYWLVTKSTTQSAVLKHAPDPAAYDSYMKAKVLLGSENEEDDKAAIEFFESAVKEDPQYAPAWAGLSRAYDIRAFYFAAADERKQLSQDAQVAAEKALAIDPELAEGHFARGHILWTHTNRFQYEQAVFSYKRAIELDPKLDEAHHQLGLIYLHIGLFDKAWAEIGKALEINPTNSLARYRYGVIDLYRGKYEDAYSISKSTPLEKNPSLHESQAATILFRLGRTAEAEAIVNRYLAEYPKDPGGAVTSVKAMILAKTGRIEEAAAAIKRAEEIGDGFGHFHHTAYNIAVAYALLRNADEAVDHLEMAADDGFPCYPLFDSDELLKDLHRNPRFIALLANLKQQWERNNLAL